MKKVKISVISYLNTSPFVYGLKHSGIIDCVDLYFDTPANCAKRLMNKDVDLGIVPAAVVPSISDKNIISNYCIGASGRVRSVVIFANCPITKIKQICLDTESRTSTMLAQTLLANYWHLDVPAVTLNSVNEIDTNQQNIGYVLIGDKVFDFEDKFKYKADLAEIWQKFTGLPFVFAVWTAVTPLANSFVADFNKALEFGVNNIPSAIKEHKHVLSYTEAIKYLTENIDYDFDFAKHKALVMFWNMVLKLKSKYRSC